MATNFFSGPMPQGPGGNQMSAGQAEPQLDDEAMRSSAIRQTG